MKTLAYYKLKDRFPGETVEYEKHLDPRFADVCVTFDTPTIPYGNGVVVEAQFKHKDKDTGQAQRDFFDHGYSVYWAYLSDFEDMSEMADLKNHRLNTVWPNAVPNIPRGLEGYSEGYQDLQTIEPGEHEMDMKLPMEYLTDHLFNIHPAEEFDADGFKNYGTAWLHGKGRDRALFKLHDTPLEHTILEFWTRDNKRDTNDHVYITVIPEDIHRIETFIDEVTTALNQSETYDTQPTWKTVTTTWIHGSAQPTGGRFSLVKPPKGKLKFLVGYQDRNGNPRKQLVKWRKGDEKRLRNNLLPLLRESLT